MVPAPESVQGTRVLATFLEYVQILENGREGTEKLGSGLLGAFRKLFFPMVSRKRVHSMHVNDIAVTT
ncbi:MAG TPA: hypothetical protein PKA06_09800 [Gemmatales bacterium]|nr:hypothetical protein [Gemmatales bacterium]HMP17435.1 hypothetical protein [Gemmatales bacterium]